MSRVGIATGALLLLSAAVFLVGCTGPMPPKPPVREPPPELDATPGDYWPSTLCRNCHVEIFEQHSRSMHARSFVNPVFQAQYFDELVPQALNDMSLFDEMKTCISCHAPVTFMKTGEYILAREQVDASMSGVTCDFCHTIREVDGETPGNGNYISIPGSQKLGPFKHDRNWHHQYSELHTKSEFCAVCHRRVNRYGVEIISTFSEWQRSPYAREGIQCQDCHMNANGFLTAGRPLYESGQAARMTVGRAPYREKLYTHRFPGAHSATQVVGALTLEVKAPEVPVSPGDMVDFRVLVDNSRAGHKMPTGSAELRLLLLDVRARIQGEFFPVPASPGEKPDPHGVTDEEMVEKTFTGGDVAVGSRVYRALYVDEGGQETTASFHAAAIKYDNRLNASEVRQETYRFQLPQTVAGDVELVGKLYYLPYPGSFAKKLGLPPSALIEIAAARTTISLQD